MSYLTLQLQSSARTVIARLAFMCRGIKRGSLQLALVTLLISAQHAALNHEVEHLRSALNHTVSLESVKHAAQSSACDFHITFAQVIGGLGSAGLVISAIAVRAEAGTSPSFLPFPFKAPVPASRGPPQLL